MKPKKNGRPARAKQKKEKYRILLLDEDSHSRLLHQHCFRKTGAELIAVKSVFGLLRQLLRNQPDLIILEYHLRGRNYYSLISCVKTLACHVPLVVQSTQGLEENRQKCAELGCDAYFVKPLDWRRYLQKVMELLDC
ncbi:MAG: response regulator [Bacteroidota bacterium]|nr:response regulator [Bacteroidota bacterium]